MPELPEVEIVKRGLEPVFMNNILEDCRLNINGLRYPFVENFTDIVKNIPVDAVNRRGKYILVHLGNDHTIIWHLGMSGRVKIYSSAQQYEAVKHDHVVLRLKTGHVVVYNDTRRFGFLDLMKTKDVETCRHFSKMGPEPLGNHFDGESFYQSLRNRKTSIKAALLDQRVVAGVGNIYACEALYMSRIDPRRAALTISRKQADSLASSIRTVLSTAIDAGGSSLKDYAHTDGSLGYFQHMFSVYDREGRPCPDCHCNNDGKCGIKRIVQSGRSTFFCATLQK